MCFPVFYRLSDGNYDLRGVWLNLDKAMKFVNEKEDKENWHWEPWPTDMLFKDMEH